MSNDYEPVPASGVGDDLFGVPELFYLTNQELITRWAALEGDAAGAAHRWLRDVLSPRVEEWATERGLASTYIRWGNYRGAVAHPPAMAVHDERPLASAGVFWSYKEIGLLNRKDRRPFVGVALDVDRPGGDDHRERFMTAGARALRDERSMRSSTRWPGWQWVDLGERWWADLDAVAGRLVNEVEEVYDAFESALLAMVESAGGEG